MNSATKVGEIFAAAGEAFSRLGDMAMHLNSSMDSNSGKSGKWTNEEIDMLKKSIQTFADDLDKISEHIKDRTISQIKQTLKKKALDDASIPEQPKVVTTLTDMGAGSLQTSLDTSSMTHDERETKPTIEGASHVVMPQSQSSDQSELLNHVVKEELNTSS